jgi:hypothetical protein
MKLEGETLRRLVEGGWEMLRGGKTSEYGDERILGSRRFVERALENEGEGERWQSKLRRNGLKAESVVANAAEIAGIKPEDVKGGGKRPKQCLARALACKWLVEDLGERGVAVAKMLGITQPAVSANVRKGREIEEERGVHLREKKG